MIPKKIKQVIIEENPDAHFIEGFDEALIGTGRIAGHLIVAVYEIDVIFEILINKHNMDEIEAYKHFQNNLKKERENPNTPIFINNFRNTVDLDEYINKNISNLLN